MSNLSQTHVNKDHPSEESLNQIECKCDQCDKHFENAVLLNQHLTLEHLREDTLTCDRCQSKWASTIALQKHIAETHRAIVFPCDLCGRTFRCRYTMTAHIRDDAIIRKLKKRENGKLWEFIDLKIVLLKMKHSRKRYCCLNVLKL